jgi:hypothetical protein
MKIISAISALAFLTGLGIAPASAQTASPPQPSAAQGEKSGSTPTDAQSQRSTAPAAEKSAVPSPPAAAKANTTPSPSAAPKAWYSDLKADALIGKDVVGKDGKKVGEIDALAKDKDQRVVAIIGVGGFLGIGEKDVAVPLTELQRAAGADRYVVPHTEDELKAMPKFAEEKYQRVDKNATLASAK